MQICEIFRGKVVDVTKRSIIIEITGTTDKIEAFETHGPAVRADRDDAHRRDRDLARARRDLSPAVLRHRSVAAAARSPRTAPSAARLRARA